MNNASTAPKGLLLTFEGLDGCGKTTQSQRCAEALTPRLQAEGRPLLVTRNPGGTVLGKALREILLHSTDPIAAKAELLLYIADRAQHWETEIAPVLAQGGVVVCDRFQDSTLAYQSFGRGLDYDWILALHQQAVTSVAYPALAYTQRTYYFAAPLDDLRARLMARGTPDRLEREAEAFHQRVADGFSAQAKREPHRVVTLDALQSIEALHAQVMADVMALLPESPAVCSPSM